MKNCLNPHISPVKPVNLGIPQFEPSIHWGALILSSCVGSPHLQAGQRSTDHHRPHGVLKDHAIGRWQDPHRRCDRQGHGQCLGDHGDFSRKKDGDFHVQTSLPHSHILPSSTASWLLHIPIQRIEDQQATNTPLQGFNLGYSRKTKPDRGW